MKKVFPMFLAAALGLSLLGGCSSSGSGTTDAETSAVTEAETASVSETSTEAETEPETQAETEAETDAAEAEGAIRVGGLNGPTTMGLVKLMEDAKNGDTDNHYEFTMVTAADELTAMVGSGKVDIALLPANVASVLYNKTQGKVAVIDINTLGVLYMVSADTSIQSIGQLAGKTVYLPGKGTTLEFKSEATEVAAILAENPDAIGLLPQPFVTVALAQNTDLSIIMDLTKVWNELQEEGSQSRLVTGVTIVNREFLENHPEAVDTFLNEHEASIAFAAEDPDTTAQLIADAGIVAKPEIAKAALPYCNITYMDGTQMKDALSGYLGVLYEQNADSVGGTLPDDAFYYIP